MGNIQKQLKSKVKFYREGTAVSECIFCKQDIWFFFDENDKGGFIEQVQHGNDPETSIYMYRKDSSFRKLLNLARWIKKIHE